MHIILLIAIQYSCRASPKPSSKRLAKKFNWDWASHRSVQACLWHCNNCPRGDCPRRQLSKGLLSKGQLSKETFVQGRLLSKWQFSKETFVQGRLLSKKTNTYIFVQGTFVTEMKKKNWKLLGTKKTNTNFLILILPTSSADASAANFPKSWCFSLFFLTF